MMIFELMEARRISDLYSPVFWSDISTLISQLASLQHEDGNDVLLNSTSLPGPGDLHPFETAIVGTY